MSAAISQSKNCGPDYGRLVSVVLASLSRYDAAEQNAVLHDTAASLYRL
jgi:predicted TIM-barrel fold metal-dependent hydrolase